MKEESLLLLSDLQKLINQVVLIDYTIIILGGNTMLSNKNTKNANFLFIADMLKDLLAQELITEKEYARAKKYYMKLTGADIVLAR